MRCVVVLLHVGLHHAVEVALILTTCRRLAHVALDGIWIRIVYEETETCAFVGVHYDNRNTARSCLPYSDRADSELRIEVIRLGGSGIVVVVRLEDFLRARRTASLLFQSRFSSRR